MRLSYILLLATLFFSCNSNRNIITINQVLLSYESGACYGKCEVFKFKVNENKTIEYEGIKNVEKTGKYKAEISVNDFNEIKELISKVNLKSIDSVYTSNSTDLHLRILNLKKKNLHKKILLFDNVPLNLKKVESKIYRIIEQYKPYFLKQ